MYGFIYKMLFILKAFLIKKKIKQNNALTVKFFYAG